MIKIFDGHTDIFTDVVVRRLKGEVDVIKNHHLERLKKGNIEGGCFVFWIDEDFQCCPEKRLQQLIENVTLELENSKEVVAVHNIKEIKKAKEDNKFYILMGMEGLSGIGENIDYIHTLYDFGVRHTSLSWNEENLLATGCKGDSKKGLTNLGKKAVNIINDKGIILDVSHLNEKSFWDTVNHSTKPIIASHSNSKVLANVPRNLTDKQLLAIRDMNGIVGLNTYKYFVSDIKSEQNLKGLVEQAIYIADTIGVEHLSFGFDFCEFIANDNDDINDYILSGLEDCSKAELLINEMIKTGGFTEKELEKIGTLNWFRVISEICKD